ncbi:unnamed protein product [Trichogramma brassicae]|uniref:3-hydroxyisobutyryl-CoA hydrolase, mitochondrial n=1 Tax=Trichogramma brassicae TaxID=86971 RepID=A0A6H5IFD8_9HYME|nr:unnamed protein product [Trichogramma brassicae]
MGGGVGLSVHGKYRVATEKTVFAMPETAIGLFPDVGGSYFLSRLKGKLGLFFGLTGYRLKGADVAFAGVATHYTTSDKLESLTQELTSRSTEVDQILEPYLPKNLNHQFCLAPYLDVIDECFSAPTVEEIISKLNYLIGTYQVPYMSIMDGITMGGGVGLSVHGKYRVATDRTLFAMPENLIGLFPDVGSSYFLPRLSGKLGLFLGLTGYRLKGADVLHAGIATHYVPSEIIDQVAHDIILNNTRVEDILKPYSTADNQEYSLSPHLKTINDCFSPSTVEGIIERLADEKSEWAKNVIETLSKLSPTSLKVTKKAFDEGIKKNLAECLSTEYRLVWACLNRNSDFYEGVRARLIDKDQTPKWNPKVLRKVTNEQIEKRFQFLSPRDELALP